MHVIINEASYKHIISHLLPAKRGYEQAAYLFAHYIPGTLVKTLEVQDFYLMSDIDFVRQENDYLELTDASRAGVIKKAHDTQTSLIEIHSHPTTWPAMFSGADRAGLYETVPHMKWRLPGRPYVAMVVAYGSFDALVWNDGAQRPVVLDSLLVGDTVLKPTNFSTGGWK